MFQYSLLSSGNSLYSWLNRIPISGRNYTTSHCIHPIGLVPFKHITNFPPSKFSPFPLSFFNASFHSNGYHFQKLELQDEETNPKNIHVSASDITSDPTLKELTENYLQLINQCKQMKLPLDDNSTTPLTNQRLDIRLFNGLISGFSKSKEYQRITEIEEVLDQLQLKPDEYTYSLLITAYLNGNMLIQAEKVFNRMQSDESMPVQLGLYSKMIEAYSKAVKIEEAVSLLNYLKLHNIKPTIIMFNNVIVATRATKNVSVAWGVFRDIEKQGLVPDEISWGGLIDTLCVSNKVDTAIKIKSLMESKGVPVGSFIYGAILIALSRDRKVELVEKYFLELRTKGHQCSPMVWKFVIECYLRTKQHEKAYILVDQMLQENVKIKPILKNILLLHCRKKGNVLWYEKRFGPMKGAEEYIQFDSQGKERPSHIKKYNQAFEDPRLDWEIDSDALSIVSEAKKKREMEESAYQERLKLLEEQFLEKPLKAQHDIYMKNQQQLLAEKKRKAKLVPSYALPKKKKSTISKKKKSTQQTPSSAVSKAAFFSPSREKTNVKKKSRISRKSLVRFLRPK